MARPEQYTVLSPHSLFPNALEITQEGVVYFTDTSAHFPRRDVMYEVYANTQSGTLQRYDTKTHTLETLLTNLSFPNGVLLVDGGAAVLVVETVKSRVLKYTIATRAVEVFAEGLPCAPDNLSLSPTGDRVWVGCATKRALPFSAIDMLLPLPSLRALLLRVLTTDMLLRLSPKYGLVLELDIASGKLLRTFQDPSGHTPFISEAFAVGDVVLLGSFRNSFLATVPLSALTDQ
jgi:hypothetical protein